MMTLLFATHNDHKVEELNQLLPNSISLISLNDIGCQGEIEETGVSLEENAKIKADCARMKYGLDCFADDSGLEIEALDGAPEFILRDMEEKNAIWIRIFKKYGTNSKDIKILELGLEQYFIFIWKAKNTFLGVV